MINVINLKNPFNAHVHFRTGPLLQVAAPLTARQFYGAIVMPNLVPPITTLEQLKKYRQEIAECVPLFRVYTTLYLTENLDVEVIKRAFKEELAIAVKYYPRGATTNSDAGIREIEKIFPKLEVMEKIGMPLCMHGEEVVDEKGEETDPYDREKIFLERVYFKLRRRFTALKISLEHISTMEAATMAKESVGRRYLFTICPQHLLFDRRDVMRDGNQPDLTCMPRIKRREHKLALRELITLGLRNVALGSDDAIHPESGKVRASGCNCGCFTSPYCLELYAQAFDEMDALQHLSDFACFNAGFFYNLEPVEDTRRVKLIRGEWSPTDTLSIPGSTDRVRPLGYREDPKKNIVLQWKMVDETFST